MLAIIGSIVYRELIINWIPVYVRFICANVYVRFCYVLLDMCEPYVRLICAFFTISFFVLFSPLPQGGLREPPREPAGGPPGAPRRRHISAAYVPPPLGGLLWGPPAGLLWRPPVGPPLGASCQTCLEEKEKRYKKVKKM